MRGISYVKKESLFLLRKRKKVSNHVKSIFPFLPSLLAHFAVGTLALAKRQAC